MSNGKPQQVTRQEVHDVFQELYQQLTDAYWVATTIEAKDQIRGIADVVFDILTELNREDIESRTADFRTLTETVKGLKPRLEKVKKEIDTIIHAVKIATNVAKGIDKAISMAASYFKLA